VLLRGETLDAEPAFGPTGGLYVNPGYTIANFGGSFTVGGGVTLIGRLINATDTRYEEVFGFPAPRRTAYLGIRVAAGR
jgi:outer membrane receptor protein involved in Fe transport